MRQTLSSAQRSRHFGSAVLLNLPVVKHQSTDDHDPPPCPLASFRMQRGAAPSACSRLCNRPVRACIGLLTLKCTFDGLGVRVQLSKQAGQDSVIAFNLINEPNIPTTKTPSLSTGCVEEVGGGNFGEACAARNQLCYCPNLWRDPQSPQPCNASCTSRYGGWWRMVV